MKFLHSGPAPGSIQMEHAQYNVKAVRKNLTQKLEFSVASQLAAA